MDEIEQQMDAEALHMLRAKTNQESAQVSVNNAKKTYENTIAKLDMATSTLANCRQALADIVAKWEKMKGGKNE